MERRVRLAAAAPAAGRRLANASHAAAAIADAEAVADAARAHVGCASPHIADAAGKGQAPAGPEVSLALAAKALGGKPTCKWSLVERGWPQ